jgi:hypothetical protein
VSGNPIYLGQPVILIHLSANKAKRGREVAACTGEPFRYVPADAYPGVPRVPCPLCTRAPE